MHMDSNSYNIATLLNCRPPYFIVHHPRIHANSAYVARTRQTDFCVVNVSLVVGFTRASVLVLYISAVGGVESIFLTIHTQTRIRNVYVICVIFSHIAINLICMVLVQTAKKTPS